MIVKATNIETIFEQNNQYTIPIFQRLYSWDTSNCNRLWNDILQIQSQNKKSHFLGSIVSVLEEEDIAGANKYMIIDGQQRITTLTLLLIALRNIVFNDLKLCKSEISTDESTNNNCKLKLIEEKSKSLESLNKFLLNTNESDDKKYKLLLTEDDRVVFNCLIDKPDENWNLPEKVKSKILNSYNFFKNSIQNSIIKNEFDLEKLLEAIGKLQIVSIILKHGEDDPQSIFECLNSTGKVLSQSDLVRNYILMNFSGKNQKELYKEYWKPFEKLFEGANQDIHMDDFIRDYLSIKLNKIFRKDKIYKQFKDWSGNNNFESIKELCADMRNMAEIYINIKTPKKFSEKLNKLFEEINILDISVMNPFLMVILKKFKDEKIFQNDLIEILKLCISYVLRRSICGMATNALNKVFLALAKSANENFDGNYLNSIKAFFKQANNYNKFPDDEEFKKAFKNSQIYKKTYIKYILTKLEHYDTKNVMVTGNMSIEHIMPQNKNLSKEWKNMLKANSNDKWEEVQDKYLHTIGNLTLTNYNSEMGDRTFEDKRTIRGGFNDTPLRINKYVVEQSEWTKEQIVERADQLSVIALKIWNYPYITEEELEHYKKIMTKINQFTQLIHMISVIKLEFYLIILKKKFLNLKM
ncbi:DUF262 domain-containing protein [Mycoplasmopsis edwardii]|nr:DUF262 domain-containing protein [Mycoplasmopsis edwardii]